MPVRFEISLFHKLVFSILSAAFDCSINNSEPWAAGTARVPSTAFQLLMKCLDMRITKKKMNIMLKHKDSPYIRCVGFLYIRYFCEPKEMWEWFEPWLDDMDEFNALSNGREKT